MRDGSGMSTVSGISGRGTPGMALSEQIGLSRLARSLSVQEGIVKLTDCRLFSTFPHEAKSLKLRRAAIDN